MAEVCALQVLWLKLVIMTIFITTADGAGDDERCVIECDDVVFTAAVCIVDLINRLARLTSQASQSLMVQALWCWQADTGLGAGQHS